MLWGLIFICGKEREVSMNSMMKTRRNFSLYCKLAALVQNRNLSNLISPAK